MANIIKCIWWIRLYRHPCLLPCNWCPTHNPQLEFDRAIFALCICAFSAIMSLMRLKGLCMMPCVYCLRQSMTAGSCLVVDGPRWLCQKKWMNWQGRLRGRNHMPLKLFLELYKLFQQSLLIMLGWTVLTWLHSSGLSITKKVAMQGSMSSLVR